MAEGSAADRTEQPTPERLRRAREEGQIPQSQEAATALVMLALVGFLAWFGPDLFQWSLREFRRALSSAGVLSNATSLEATFSQRAADGLLAMAPILGGILAASVAGGLLASGWSFSPKAVKLNFSRLAPGQGLKELFSSRSGIQIVTSLAKLIVLSIVVWRFLQSRMDEFLVLRQVSISGLLARIAGLGFGVLVRITIALCVIASMEVFYQRWSYKRRLRMSKQELKEERRQHELAPEVRGRIRSIRMAMMRRRMLRDVAKADVVLANPTHVAVALRYRPADMEAPQVVAKGAELLCEKIKEIARQHNVPVVEKPELARAVYAAAEIGQTIPETLFVAVAEVLAMVYRLRKQRQGLSR
jgi:flagellar biosynthesis protein FlhB